MVERVALEAFRAVARTSPGRTRLSIFMHSLNRGPTNGTYKQNKKNTLVNVALTQIQIFLLKSGLREI